LVHFENPTFIVILDQTNDGVVNAADAAILEGR